MRTLSVRSPSATTRGIARPTVSRLVLVFNKRTEYFLNCQHVKDGPLAAEIEGGCDQLIRSFRLTK